MRTTKTIWFINFLNKWEASTMRATLVNLEYVRKNLALNGQCEIFHQTVYGAIKGVGGYGRK